jgi:uncharacterized protein (TIGR02453 family)
MPRSISISSKAPVKRAPVSSEISSGFTAQTLSFLRGLAKNNDREWFEARRETYQHALREPMLQLIATVNKQMEGFAPLHVKAPEKTVLRIYRDTRFSKSKLPYKQHYAAWWGRAGMVKTSGAGYYFHLSAKQLHIAAGLYMPDPAQTLQVRRHLLEHHEKFRALLASRALKSRMQLSDPQALTRAPKGFPAEHPASDLILFRNWGVDVELAPEEALGPRFSTVLARYFHAAAPLVDFLNASLAAPVEQKRRPIFALDAM